MGGTCDEGNFYVKISYGNIGKNFNIMLGTRDLTPARSAEYGMKENATHISLVVPFLALDVAFEVWLPFVTFVVYIALFLNVSLYLAADVPIILESKTWCVAMGARQQMVPEWFFPGLQLSHDHDWYVLLHGVINLLTSTFHGILHWE